MYTYLFRLPWESLGIIQGKDAYRLIGRIEPIKNWALALCKNNNFILSVVRFCVTNMEGRCKEHHLV